MNIKRNQQVDGSPRIQRRRGAVITSAVALLSFGGMFAVAHEKLTAAGYIDVGLDHFARP